MFRRIVIHGRNARAAIATAQVAIGASLVAFYRTLVRRGRLLAVSNALARRTEGRTFQRATGALLVVLLFCLIVFIEVRTSWVQSSFFSLLASRLQYTVEPGASREIVPPGNGPVDDSRGYAEVMDLQKRLVRAGFRVVEQSRFSVELATSARLGLSPPQPEPTTAGLVINDGGGRVLYDATATQHRFERYEDIPPLAVRSLLYIENRRLDAVAGGRTNPAVDWGRLSRAAVLSLAHRAGLPATFQGGSTLAVQLEKFRHSGGGRTASATEKFKQIVSASLAAYHDGPDTRDEQRQIVLDYLNSMPLAATTGAGEVYGLGNGLKAWFGLDPATTFAHLESRDLRTRADATRAVLALVCAVRAPTRYLKDEPKALERRSRYYARQLAIAGILDPALVPIMFSAPLRVVDVERPPTVVSFDDRKPVNLVRSELMKVLRVRSLYELDRLHAEVQTTLDAALQDSVMRLFHNLADPQFVTANGLVGPRLLGGGDPRSVVYSLRLVEHGADGEQVLVHADNLDKPFDVNRGMRLELGSTAKLRTLVHYLEVVALLHGELHTLGKSALKRAAREARDPITTWATAQLLRNPGQPLDPFLEASLERTYSASPGEVFFTGGGEHVFHNFDPLDDRLAPTLREATANSTNLVFVRLMRDLVRYHAARLPYDVQQALDRQDDPERLLMLDEIADDEALAALGRSYQAYRGITPRDLATAVLGSQVRSPKKIATLYYAWNRQGSVDSLRAWLVRYAGESAGAEAERLASKYGSGSFTLADYGYLLNHHPLDVWAAGELYRNPRASWSDIVTHSGDARRESSTWLFKTRHRHAQDVRLRSRVEQHAFERMTPYWRHLGFPFERLVPSYATAIGSSADRPDALSDLMGIIVNDGMRRSSSLVRRVRLAPGTPYHTVLEAKAPTEERVLDPAVARAVRGVLAGVVEHGTAHRVFEAYRDHLGNPVVVGGKTGSGDNRIKRYAGGRMIESRAVSRSAAFTFYIGDRHYGVITASVQGPESGQFYFTSSLPLAVMKLLAPAIDQRLAAPNVGPRVAFADANAHLE